MFPVERESAGTNIWVGNSAGTVTNPKVGWRVTGNWMDDRDEDDDDDEHSGDSGDWMAGGVRRSESLCPEVAEAV